jgi:hypothetical protein
MKQDVWTANQDAWFSSRLGWAETPSQVGSQQPPRPLSGGLVPPPLIAESMKSTLLMLGLLAVAAPAHAVDARFMASLNKLDPKTRLEQVCDLEAMGKIGQISGGVRADRAKSDAVSPPQHLGDMLIAKGAAFRAGGKWYRVTFTCKATPDHKTVLDFTYKTGAAIPAAQWPLYGLWK